MHIILIAALLVQDDAEAILKKTRAKLDAAKTIRVTGELQGPGEEPFKLEFVIKGKDRYRLAVSGKRGAETMEALVIGDGRRVVVAGEFPPEAFGTKPDEVPLLMRGSRFGPSLLILLAAEGGGKVEVEKIELKPREKVGKRDAHLFEYVMKARGEEIPAKTWIDVETFLPLKHELSPPGMSIVEEYSESVVDADAPDSLFATITKAGVTKALAKQVATSIALYQTYTGARPRDLAALTTKGDADVFWPPGGYALGGVPRGVAFDGANVTADGISIPVPPPSGQPIRPPSDRLAAHYTARVRVQLIAAALQAYREAYREFPSSLADLTTKPAWAEIWPEDGFARTVPKDYVLEAKATALVRCVGVERVKADALTADEKAKLEESSRPRLSDADRARAEALIAKLGEDDLEARSAAAAELARMGGAVRSLLEPRIETEKSPELLARLKDVQAKIPAPVPAWRTELGPLTARVRVAGTRNRGRDVSCMNNLKQLWTMQANYMAQFGGREKLMPKETGVDFWLALSRTTPPLIDESLKDIYVCPGSGETDGCTYWGPASDVNEFLDDGDPVGMCDDPSHGEEVLILRKSGDVMPYKRTDPVYQAALKKLKGPDGD